jgi:hypothetical protein
VALEPLSAAALVAIKGGYGMQPRALLTEPLLFSVNEQRARALMELADLVAQVELALRQQVRVTPRHKAAYVPSNRFA